jgi:hypothetical protein
VPNAARVKIGQDGGRLRPPVAWQVVRANGLAHRLKDHADIAVAEKPWRPCGVL